MTGLSRRNLLGGAAAVTANDNKSQPPAEPQKDEPKK